MLEQRKPAGAAQGRRPGDRFYWYASTAWIMWNIATSALLIGATVVVHDGAPAYPAVDAQFALAARTGVTYLGTSAGYLTACEKAGVRPGEQHDLSARAVHRLDRLAAAGGRVPLGLRRGEADVFLGSLSGGTDVATGFIGSSLLLPVTAGELQRPMLGVAAAAWDEEGGRSIGELGELVVTEPMPSMPLYFWNDPDGTRYREAYFEPWPGVWRHGDWLEITERGTCVITGRSDSTLNRGGVRMGTADIYAAVESIPEVADCVVLGVEQPDGGYWMPLFVQLAPGEELTDELVARLREAIREQASPRHVPDEMIAVPGVPHTRTGKRLEVPLKRLFQGVDPAKAVNTRRGRRRRAGRPLRRAGAGARSAPERPRRAAHWSSMIVLASAIRPSSIMASASSKGSSRTSMSSPSSASPPPAAGAVGRGVGRGEEVQPLGHRAGAHEDVEHVLHLADGDAELLLDLAADGVLRGVVVEQPGGRLDQHPVGVAVDVDGVAELPGEQHGAPLHVVEQEVAPLPRS